MKLLLLQALALAQAVVLAGCVGAIELPCGDGTPPVCPDCLQCGSNTNTMGAVVSIDVWFVLPTTFESQGVCEVLVVVEHDSNVELIPVTSRVDLERFGSVQKVEGLETAASPEDELVVELWVETGTCP